MATLGVIFGCIPWVTEENEPFWQESNFSDWFRELSESRFLFLCSFSSALNTPLERFVQNGLSLFLQVTNPPKAFVFIICFLIVQWGVSGSAGAPKCIHGDALCKRKSPSQLP